MDANELRIGNWVDLGGGRNLYQISDEIYGGLNLNPIPLTEKWLTKFGFVKGGNYFSINIDSWDSTIYLLSEEDDEYVVYFEEENKDEHHANNHVSLCAIKSVHQLQNLYFALTGKDLQLT